MANTALGGLLAISGGVAGQFWSERKAVAREAREREQEREVWARSLRHEAHLAFLAEFDRKATEVIDANLRHADGEPDYDYLATVWDLLQALRLVANQTAVQAGERAYEALRSFTFGDGTWPDVDRQRDLYVAAIRDEHGLPAIPPKRD